MRCPGCGHIDDKVLETRVVRDGAAIRRRRECDRCSHRFTTYEYVESASFEVVKKDGRREPFHRAKVLRGLARACEKRPISRFVLEDLVDKIEHALVRTGTPEIKSSDIGAQVMKALRDLDPVGYVRFASVYQSFQDIRQFLETIESLPADSGRDTETTTEEGSTDT